MEIQLENTDQIRSDNRSFFLNLKRKIKTETEFKEYQ